MRSVTFNKVRLVSGAGLERMLFQVSPSWAQIITDDLDPETTLIQSTRTEGPEEFLHDPCGADRGWRRDI